MTDEINEDGYTFKAWRARANRRAEALSGVTLDDLADGNERDAWNDGMNPAEYADELLDSEGFPNEDER